MTRPDIDAVITQSRDRLKRNILSKWPFVEMTLAEAAILLDDHARLTAQVAALETERDKLRWHAEAMADAVVIAATFCARIREEGRRAGLEEARQRGELTVIKGGES